MIRWLRKNVGVLVAAFGFLLLCILTFGDLGDFMTEQYWLNVKENLMAISYMTVALTLIQTVIKQGVGEQALQRGLNTENASRKYEEHRKLLQECTDKLAYVPYFLQIYNDRHTALRKREFLVNNNYTSEKNLYASGCKHLIRKYERIHTHITLSSIKWATTEIVYDKRGRIVSLGAYKRKQLLWGIVWSLLLMVATAFLTKGLFFEADTTVPLWQKFVKLLTYVVTIALGSVLTIVKNFEKGAFSVPNELDDINSIWREFKSWDVPEWVRKEVDEQNEYPKEVTNGAADEKGKDTADGRAVIQEEQTTGESADVHVSDRVLDIHSSDDPVLLSRDTQFGGEHNGDTAPAG